MHSKVLATLLTALAYCQPTMAQRFESPEAALAEHIAAYQARDVPRFLDSIDFDQEAREQLLAKHGAGTHLENSDVHKLAQSLRDGLATHFAKFSFRAGTFDNCRPVTKFQDSESAVRLVLSCNDPRGATVFPVRVLRFSDGWQVVRGG